MDGYVWETQWEYCESPMEKAFIFPDDPKIFPKKSGLARNGRISFQQFPNPMSSARWVELRDPFSLSLLQARLKELDLGVVVRDD
jgi:hypothetical protein